MKFSLELGGFNLSLGRSQPVNKRQRMRSFPGANYGRLTADWASPSTSADAEIWSQRRTLIYRCRQLERENDYVRRYLKLVTNNVLGAEGVGLQMKIQDEPGRYDKAANDAIEAGWRNWGRRSTASLNQRYSWKQIEWLCLRSAARDGGALVRIHRPADNPYSFTLEPLEIDYLDFDYNTLLTNGNEVRQGIEFDSFGRFVNFHIFSRHPGDTYQSRRQRIPVPASDMIYIHWPERIGQTACAPSLMSAMLRLKQLGGYEEAELVAARVASCKGGFIKKSVPEGWTGDDEDSAGNQISSIEPGSIEELPMGMDFVPNDPTHPNTAYNDFIKGVLRGLASGLGVSYTSLANDLEGVNYSSIRAGLLEEREEWKSTQCWFIENLHEPVFGEWQSMSLLRGAIKLPGGSSLPLSKLEKFSNHKWSPRRWPWVDPLKDMQANIESVKHGFSSRRRIIAEQGADIEDVFQEQSEDNALAKQYGLNLGVDDSQQIDGKDNQDPNPAPDD